MRTYESAIMSSNGLRFGRSVSLVTLSPRSPRARLGRAYKHGLEEVLEGREKAVDQLDGFVFRIGRGI